MQQQLQQQFRSVSVLKRRERLTVVVVRDRGVGGRVGRTEREKTHSTQQCHTNTSHVYLFLFLLC